MSEPHDEQFENYLRSFRPVDPETLPVRAKRHAAGVEYRSKLAAIAVACAAAAALVMIVLPRSPQGTNEQVARQVLNNANRSDISGPALTKLALDDHAVFVEFMSDKAESQFPQMRSEQSTLRVLAKQ